jgi:hypothetical protein
MKRKSYDFYKHFRRDGQVVPMPFIRIPERDTDRWAVYVQGQTKVSLLSDSYYGSPFYDKLILMANPQHGGLEWDIPDGALVRIPYPLDEALEDYDQKAREAYKR